MKDSARGGQERGFARGRDREHRLVFVDSHPGGSSRGAQSSAELAGIETCFLQQQVGVISVGETGDETEYFVAGE